MGDAGGSCAVMMLMEGLCPAGGSVRCCSADAYCCVGGLSDERRLGGRFSDDADRQG